MPDMRFVAPIAGAIGLLAALIIYFIVAKMSSGSEKMGAIAEEIHMGAMTFLKAEYAKVAMFVIVIGALIAWGLGWQTALAFVGSALSSAIAGFFGIKAATKGNVRTAGAAHERGLATALSVAFNSGAVTGLSVASFALLTLGVAYYFFSYEDSLQSIIVGVALGGSAMALFARIAGGIFTKAADVGTDLVGKVEAGIPENDARNPGVIADHVGDSIGDVGGASADVYESYVGAIAAAIAIAVPMSTEQIANIYPGTDKTMLVVLPLFLALLGLGVSLISIVCMQMFKNARPTFALALVDALAKGLFAIAAGFAMHTFGYDLDIAWAVLSGVACGFLIGKIAGLYTAGRPVSRVAEAAKTGAATNIISGFAVGLESAAAPLLLVALTIFASYEFAGLYGIAISAVGMLATIGVRSAIDSFSPVVDNAAGIAQMAHLPSEVRAVTSELDEAGTLASARGKAFAVTAAALTSLSLFVAFREIVKAGSSAATIDIADPRVLIGLFLGSLVVLIAASLTMKSVAKAAGQMVFEIRRQFKEIPGLLNGTGKPDTGRCVEISAQSALREMVAPVVLVVAAPLAIGFGLDAVALGGALVGAFITGIAFALFMTNTGSIWSNATKYIEADKVQGVEKGGEVHAASVIGDTVGDPFKDTTGPALNILVKLMAIVALAIAPLLR